MEGIVLKTALKTFNFVMLRQYCVQWVPSVSNREKNNVGSISPSSRSSTSCRLKSC